MLLTENGILLFYINSFLRGNGMKILGHTRAFSFRKVTLGAVTALIGLGTIGAMGNQAQASTHSSYSQSHRTTTNGKST